MIFSCCRERCWRLRSDSLNEAVAAASPAATVGLDPASSKEIGTSATDFRSNSGKDADAQWERISVPIETNKPENALEPSRNNPGNPGGTAPGHFPAQNKDNEARTKRGKGDEEKE